VADYWAGITLEGTHEEEDVEHGDANSPTPHAPRIDPVGRHEGASTSGNCWSWKK
jgi:hypothetical protein